MGSASWLARARDRWPIVSARGALDLRCDLGGRASRAFGASDTGGDDHRRGVDPARDRAALDRGFLPASIATAGPAEPIVPIPLTAALDRKAVALGERLFHDARLSGDNTRSCATCHPTERGLTRLQREALVLATERGEVSRAAFIARYGISRWACRRGLAGLVTAGLLRKVGARRATRYMPTAVGRGALLEPSTRIARTGSQFQDIC